MKIVINSDYGSFGLSDKATRRLFELKKWKCLEKIYNGFTLFYKDSMEEKNIFNDREIDRNDLDLVKVVEELGEHASGYYAVLKIVDIPDDVQWHIHEYDGLEHVAEDHRIWN